MLTVLVDVAFFSFSMPNPPRSRMKDDDIENYFSALQDGFVSEDEDNDDDDLDFNPTQEELDVLEDEIRADEVDNTEDPPLVFENDSEDQVETAAVTSTCPGVALWRIRSRQLIWKKQNMVWDEGKTNFLGDQRLSEAITSLETPFNFFSYYLNEQIISKIVDETNLYITQKSISNCPPTNLTEIRNFFGILIFMSVYHYPSVRSYWSKYGFSHIIQTMPLNRFEKLRSAIHFNDNALHKPVNHPNHDRIHKIRPLVDHLNKMFSSVPFDQKLSLDEQMCATKIGHFMKQYLPNKPHKWGFKLFVICSLLGYAYLFEIYTGQEAPRRPEEPDLNSVGNTVLRLCRPIPRYINHIIYFDNFYTSIPLLHYLNTQGIFTLGTIQRNRLGKNCKLPNQKDFMKDNVPRGSYEEYVADYEGTEISATCWKDNKMVTLASTYVGAEPAGTVKRYDKKAKKEVIIPCPKIISDYNAHMGGVDLMDSFLGRYRIRVKSRKWYLRLFYHLLDLTVINSWILYKKSNDSHGKTMSLADFRSELAETLCAYKKTAELKRGRPSSLNVERELEAKRRRGPMQRVPPKDVRTDGVGHKEIKTNIKSRCKLPNCKGFTRTKCSKCSVALCHTQSRNCFDMFHN